MKFGSAPRIKQRLADALQPVGTEDHLVVDYPQPRLRISRGAATVIACIAIICGGAFFVYIRATPPPPVPASVAALDEAPRSAATPSKNADTGTETSIDTSIVVAVVGEVEHPGLYTLAPQARVADALDAATTSPHAHTDGINIAQKLTDGQQVYVPNSDEPQPPPLTATPAGDVAGTATTQVSLNTASLEELTQLSGVGEKTAAAIIAYRDSHGGFRTIDELQEVKGIGPAKFAAIASEVTL